MRLCAKVNMIWIEPCEAKRESNEIFIFWNLSSNITFQPFLLEIHRMPGVGKASANWRLTVSDYTKTRKCGFRTGVFCQCRFLEKFFYFYSATEKIVRWPLYYDVCAFTYKSWLANSICWLDTNIVTVGYRCLISRKLLNLSSWENTFNVKASSRNAVAERRERSFFGTIFSRLALHSQSMLGSVIILVGISFSFWTLKLTIENLWSTHCKRKKFLCRLLCSGYMLSIFWALFSLPSPWF